MNRNAVDKLIQDAASEIASLAVALNGLAQGASACAAGGNASGAVQILLEIEPQIHDLQRLLDVASFAS